MHCRTVQVPSFVPIQFGRQGCCQPVISPFLFLASFSVPTSRIYRTLTFLVPVTSRGRRDLTPERRVSQGHLHQTTVVLATQLLFTLLCSPPLLARFRDGGCTGGWAQQTESVIKSRLGAVLGEIFRLWSVDWLLCLGGGGNVFFG